MKFYLSTLFCFFFLMLLSTSISAQVTEAQIEASTIKSDFSDRKAVLETISNFYIGDHTGSIKHKKLSMHEKGAYRYVNRNGEYSESIFQLDSDDSDQNYKEELLSVDIYNTMAIARLRLDQFKMDQSEYKIMTLFKTNQGWKITSIIWGFGVTP